jgi:hypothetical protein
MSLFTDSYTTTAGSATDTRKIIAAIKEVVVTEDLDSKPESSLDVQSHGGIRPLFITGTYPGEEKIPTFAHPIYISGIRGGNVISTDLRFVLRKKTEGSFAERISDRINFEYLVSRTILELYWATGRKSEFISGFVFAAKVFGSWLAQILRTFGLNPEEMLHAEALALAYYYDLCMDSKDPLYSANGRYEWVVANSMMSPDKLAVLLDDVKPFANFNDFISVLKHKIQNYQITKLTPVLFLQKIANSWYGLNREKVLAVCVEHPPTWTALVHHSLSSKSFKNCLIAQVASKARRSEADAFMHTYYATFSQSLRQENSAVEKIVYTTMGTFDYDPNALLAEVDQRCPKL